MTLPDTIHWLNWLRRKQVDGRRGVVNNAETMNMTNSGKPARKLASKIANKLANKRLAVLGAGKIGGILLRAFLEQKLVQPKRVHATVRHVEKAWKRICEEAQKLATGE